MALRNILPAGGSLSAQRWTAQHRGLTRLLFAQAAMLALFGLLRGYPPLHSALDAGVVVAFATAASLRQLSPRLRACTVALGMVTTSAVFVHLSGGATEAHFHFFVMVGLLSLYQEWLPFLLAIGFVVVHHGLMGALAPAAVYGANPAAVDQPWRWAAIHGSFVLAASVASIVAWRLNEHEALHDTLTGLPNRALLTDRVEHALAARAPAKSLIAVLFVDLDGFKAVNDSMGHAAGDELLRRVGAALQTCVRAGDTCSRLGGDEFAVLLDGIEGPATALDVAQRILEVTGEPSPLAGGTVHVTASVGIAISRAGAASADDLLRNADMAMYTAKRRGKNRVDTYEPAMHATLLRRLELEADLVSAVGGGELVVHYQPIVELEARRLAGFEALVRWRHPTKGLLQPSQFIGLAEETGMIGPIGAWVLDEATTQLAAWNRNRSEPLHLTVNVSARQLHDSTFPDEVERAIRRSGVSSRDLTLEITESVLMSDVWVMLDRLEALHRLGVGLAIDDFGTGYSSLGYLRRFPFDTLKVDRSFVDAVLRSPRDEAVLAAILQLGRALDLDVVAEGIESEAQLQKLVELGCPAGQGFRFRAPGDASDATSVLAVTDIVGAQAWELAA